MDSINSPYTQIARWGLAGFQVLTSPDSKKPPKKKDWQWTGTGPLGFFTQQYLQVGSFHRQKLQWWSWGTKILGEISSTMASIDWSSNSSSRSSFKISACTVEWENLPERQLWRHSHKSSSLMRLTNLLNGSKIAQWPPKPTLPALRPCTSNM